MLAASLLLAVLVGSVLAMLVLTINGFRQTAQRVRHSEEVIASANQLEKQVLDLETGERGFMLTRREASSSRGGVRAGNCPSAPTGPGAPSPATPTRRRRPPASRAPPPP